MRERIESAANKKIKLAASLKKRKNRRETGLFIAEGVRLAELAVASDYEIEFALYTEDCAADARAAAVLAALESRGVTLCETTAALYKKASATETPQGLMLIMRAKKYRLAELMAVDTDSAATSSASAQAPLFVVLDGVQDPGNVGTIIRTADAVGASGVILLEGTADAYSDKTVRASMGSLFHIPMVEGARAAEMLTLMEERGLTLYATALDETAREHFVQDFTRPCAIVLGNEGSGVSEAVLARAEKTYIPMYGHAESLNVGMSAAIVLYEAVRQRRFS